MNTIHYDDAMVTPGPPTSKRHLELLNSYLIWDMDLPPQVHTSLRTERVDPEVLGVWSHGYAYM